MEGWKLVHGHCGLCAPKTFPELVVKVLVWIRGEQVKLNVRPHHASLLLGAFRPDSKIPLVK